MTSLRPYQQQLLEVLRNPNRPRIGMIPAITGAGIRRVVGIYVQEIATTSSVLILCPTLVMTYQWASLIEVHEDINVRALGSASDALDILEKETGNQAGVLITTYARAHHGPSRRVLSELNFGLVVHDLSARRASDEISSLNVRASQAIVLAEGQQLISNPLRWPLLWNVSVEQISQDGHILPNTIKIPYRLSPEERALRSEAINVLQARANAKGTPFPLISDSLPELHRMLLNLASDDLEQKDLSRQAWLILDRMEASRFVDSRLAALDGILREPAVKESRCIIVTATVTDGHYIANHLESIGKAPRAFLSAETRSSDRRTILTELSHGECLIATHAISDPADEWLTDTTVILWPSSRNQRMIENLFRFGEELQDINLFELSEVKELDAPAL